MARELRVIATVFPRADPLGLSHLENEMMTSPRPDIRSFIADQIGLAVEQVTDEVRFADDLRFDRFDRLELAMQIEDKFGVEFSQEAVEQIEAVGDLIRYVESDLLRGRPVIIPPSLVSGERQR